MKKGMLVLVVFVLPLFSFSQVVISNDSLLHLVFDSLKKFDSQFNCRSGKDISTKKWVSAKIVSSNAFDSMYRKAATRIISGSQDYIKNGRASVLDFNEALKRLTINYSWAARKKDRMWNAGFTAEDAGRKTFQIFAKDGWKEGFTFNFGKAVPLTKNAILFLPKTCDTLSMARNVFYARLIKKYQTTLNTNDSLINDIHSRDLLLNAFDIRKESDYRNTPRNVTESELKLYELYIKLDSFKRYSDYRNDFQKLYENDIRDFEVANLTKFGYRIQWINWNFSAGLKRFNIYDTAVIRLAEVGKRNLARVTGSLTYNFFRESSYKRITYFSAELSMGNTNFIEEILPQEVTILKSVSGNTTFKEDYDALVIKDYDNLKRNYMFTSIGFVYNYFPSQLPFLKKLGRFMGFEFGGNTKLKFFEPENVAARNLFSLRGGLLFTFENNGVAKTTFGIIASLADVPYNDLTSKDRFTIGLRLGVPFNY